MDVDESARSNSSLSKRQWRKYGDSDQLHIQAVHKASLTAERHGQITDIHYADAKPYFLLVVHINTPSGEATRHLVTDLDRWGFVDDLDLSIGNIPDTFAKGLQHILEAYNRSEDVQLGRQDLALIKQSVQSILMT